MATETFGSLCLSHSRRAFFYFMCQRQKGPHLDDERRLAKLSNAIKAKALLEFLLLFIRVKALSCVSSSLRERGAFRFKLKITLPPSKDISFQRNYLLGFQMSRKLIIIVALEWRRSFISLAGLYYICFSESKLRGKVLVMLAYW